jgi:hypothetical protein
MPKEVITKTTVKKDIPKKLKKNNRRRKKLSRPGVNKLTKILDSIKIQKPKTGFKQFQRPHPKTYRESVMKMIAKRASPYKFSLLYPEYAYQAKISRSSVDTVSHHMTIPFSFTVNAGGNAAFIWFPQTITESGLGASTFFVHNGSLLDGLTIESTQGFKAIAVPMNITANLFKQVRLVSASARLFSPLSLLNATAKAVIASGTTDMPTAIAVTGATPTGGVTTFNQFTLFSAIDNMKYRSAGLFQHGNSVRAIWLPSTAEDIDDFVKINVSCYSAAGNQSMPCGFICGYITGAPASSQIQGELALNVEFATEPNTIFSDMAWTTMDSTFTYDVLSHIRNCPEEITLASNDLEGSLGKSAANYSIMSTKNPIDNSMPYY